MNTIKLLAAGLLMAGLSFAAPSEAQTETFTIQMNHKQFTGQGRTIRLKNELSQAYPGWDFSDARLSQVRFFAKSRRGNGQVELQVGNTPQDRRNVTEGSSWSSTSSRSYNEIRLDSASSGRGPWTLVLDGNIKVLKIEVRARGADAPEQEQPEEPTTRWVNLGTASTIKIVPTSQSFNVRADGRAEGLRIEARDNLLVVTDVTVQYDNGVHEKFDALKGEYFQGQFKEVQINNRNVRRVYVTALTAIPFGADATYRVRLLVNE